MDPIYGNIHLRAYLDNHALRQRRLWALQNLPSVLVFTRLDPERWPTITEGPLTENEAKRKEAT